MKKPNVDCLTDDCLCVLQLRLRELDKARLPFAVISIRQWYQFCWKDWQYSRGRDQKDQSSIWPTGWSRTTKSISNNSPMPLVSSRIYE